MITFEQMITEKSKLTEREPTLYLVNTSFVNPYLHQLGKHKITGIIGACIHVYTFGRRDFGFFG